MIKIISDQAFKIRKSWVSKEAATESTEITKKEGLFYLASERERIMKMSHDDALRELVKMRRIDSKIKTIKAISDFGIFSIN